MKARWIEFRALPKVGNGWVYGGFYETNDGKAYIFDRIKQKPIEVKRDTVCQDTDIVDNENTVIFDGDIICFNNGKSIGEIVWQVGNYYICCDGYDCEEDGSCCFIDILKNGSSYMIDGKIIGNIYYGIYKENGQK